MSLLHSPYLRTIQFGSDATRCQDHAIVRSAVRPDYLSTHFFFILKLPTISLGPNLPNHPTFEQLLHHYDNTISLEFLTEIKKVKMY